MLQQHWGICIKQSHNSELLSVSAAGHVCLQGGLVLCYWMVHVKVVESNHAAIVHTMLWDGLCTHSSCLSHLQHATVGCCIQCLLAK